MSLDGVFICIAAALGSPSKSFEEVRVDDYVSSYQTSGRPPPPAPQEPTNETQRKALGLPPLFKPQMESTHVANGVPGTSSSALLGENVASSSLLSQNSSTTQIVTPANIPLSQEFKVHIVAAEKYHNIVCMPEFEGFSPEELRYYAYLRGNITSPVPITMEPFTASDQETSTTVTPTTTSDEKFQSQCTFPEYSKHSPEELRMAWMAFGREMNSNDLLGSAVPHMPPAPSLGTAAVPPSEIPPPILAAATPIASNFNFVFR